MYFDRPSFLSENGPNKFLEFNDSEPSRVLFSIFPDRDGIAEEHEFSIKVNGAESDSMAIRVIDEDNPEREVEFPMHFDWSFDNFGFAENDTVRDIVEQAANDWA